MRSSKIAKKTRPPERVYAHLRLMPNTPRWSIMRRFTISEGSLVSRREEPTTPQKFALAKRFLGTKGLEGNAEAPSLWMATRILQWHHNYRPGTIRKMMMRDKSGKTYLKKVNVPSEKEIRRMMQLGRLPIAKKDPTIPLKKEKKPAKKIEKISMRKLKPIEGENDLSNATRIQLFRRAKKYIQRIGEELAKWFIPEAIERVTDVVLDEIIIAPVRAEMTPTKQRAVWNEYLQHRERFIVASVIKRYRRELREK